jgi:16S rRNA processing protein RimM
MGRVIAPYGVQGWIKARALTALPDGLLAYRTWWLTASEDQWREFPVLDARMHANSLLARLEGLNRREDVAPWRGATIGVPRALLPALVAGEFYLTDLVGLTILNRTGETLGRVAGLLETGAHPVLRVASSDGVPGRERLIPLVPAYVDAIDLAGGRIVVDWQADF